MKLFKYKEFINENKYLGLKTSDDYINVDKENLTITFERLPEQNEVQIPVQMQLVVEYYNRLT